MDHDESTNLVGWANLAPALGFAWLWLLPITVFWGTVFGPLAPRSSAAVNTSPNIRVFMLFGLATLAPMALPRSCFIIKAPRRAQRLSRLLGVRSFKRFVMNGDLVLGLARRGHPGYRALAGRAELAAFFERTRAVERWHLVLLLMSLFSAIHALRIGWYGWAAALTAGNVICNAYPILLQRYHRARAHVGLRASERGTGTRTAV